MKTIGTKSADHIVARISGVNAGDTRVEAAEKVVATMRGAGFPKSAIAKAERMLAEIKRQNGVK